MDFEIRDVVQGEDRRVRNPRGADAEEIGIPNIVQDERRTMVGFRGADLDVIELNAPGVANVETVGRHFAEHVGLRIVFLFLDGLDRCLRIRAAAPMPDLYVADRDILDVVARDSADDGTESGGGIGTDQIADDHALQRPHRRAGGSSHSTAQTQKDGRW